jgi:LDH2 family malate/lactate/ureidoglycolate dehydrogenase
MAPNRIRLSVGEARELAERAMRGIGYDQEEARIVADHAIDAALCGYEYSGLAKLLNIPEHRRFKQPRRPISVVRETELSTLYDGGNNVGMLALYHATRGAIAQASARGVAIVGVTNSWMSGRSAYYVEMIANAGLVGIHTAGSAPSVAPPGACVRCLVPTRSPSASHQRADPSSSIWGPRLLWEPIWRTASVWERSCRKE